MTFPRNALKELGEMGVLDVVVPEAFGGVGLGYLSLALSLEEIAGGDGSASTIVSVQNSLGRSTTGKFGTTVDREAGGRMIDGVNQFMATGEDAGKKSISGFLVPTAGQRTRLYRCAPGREDGSACMST